MTEELTPNRKKKINWKEKSASDSARISKRLEGRELLAEEATTLNSATLKKIPPLTTQPLNRLRKKIKEVYDDEEDDEDENGTVFFNINLLDEENTDHKNDSPQKADETLQIMKEQQMAGKLNSIMSANLATEDLNLPSRITKEDERLLNSAEYDTTETRRQILKNKITKPLGIEGDIPEQELKKTLQDIKTIQKELSLDDLAPLKTKDISDIAEEKDENEMAKLILEKTGRQLPCISTPMKRKLEKRVAEEYKKRKEKSNE